MQSLQPVRTLPLLLTHKQKEGARSGDNHVCVNVDRLVLTSTRVLALRPARICPAPSPPLPRPRHASTSAALFRLWGWSECSGHANAMNDDRLNLRLKVDILLCSITRITNGPFIY